MKKTLNSDIKENENLKYYFYFLTKRMKIFWNKKDGKKSPWSDDEILNKNKFTNVYRVLDRVSQYLVKNIINNKKYSKKDIIFRIIFFKIFNKIETWEFLEKELGEISIKTFNVEKISDILEKRRNKKPIFSQAYIMTGSCGIYKDLGKSKHRKWLQLLDDNFVKGNTSEKIIKAKSLEEIYKILISLPMIGKFLAYQYSIDLNYSNVINFSENDFVVAGPGAVRGIEKTFDKFDNYENVIKYVFKNFDYFLDKYGFKNEFKNIYGRNPTLIDLQNVFCETDKYLRDEKPELSVGNKRIKQKYKINESFKKDKIECVFPEKWGI